MEQNIILTASEVKPRKKTLIIGGQNYSYLHYLDRGGYGSVHLLEKKTSKFAVKIIRKDKLSKASQENLLVELKVLEITSGLNFFLNLFQTFEDKKCHYFVLNYVSGGNLHKRLRRAGTFSEDVARFYLGEIAVALESLHSLGFIHRDLKLENVLLHADGHIALADFGLAKRTTDYEDMYYCGTSKYIAPEMLLDKGYNAAIDIWALGIMAFEMLTGGLHPFRSYSGKMTDRILSEEPRMPDPNPLTITARKFIMSLLNKDPEMRPYSCADFATSFKSYQLMHDPFFWKLDWPKLKSRQLLPPFNPT